MTVTARQEQSKLEQQPVLSVVLTMKVVVCTTGLLEGPTSVLPVSAGIGYEQAVTTQGVH